jgi:hypothetical protein
MLIILYHPTTSSMGDDHRWMYDGWNKSGVHSKEWWDKTKDFIERAFPLLSTSKIRSTCYKCENVRCFEKLIVTKHLCQNGFVPNYETWVFHG